MQMQMPTQAPTQTTPAHGRPHFSHGGGAPGGAKRARRDSFAACCGAVDEAPMPWSVVDVAVVFEQLAGVAGGASYLSSSPSPSPEQAPMAPPSLPLLPLVL